MIPAKELALLFGLGICFLIVIGLLKLAGSLFEALLIRLFGPQTPKYQYAPKRYLMTKNERECFDSLMKGVGNEFYIFPQVHLDALLDHRIRGQRSMRGARMHISQKSVDFVLCREDLSVVLVIELDDWSHDRPDRRERDRVVEALFASVGMPLLRIPHGGASDSERVAQLVRVAIQPVAR